MSIYTFPASEVAPPEYANISDFYNRTEPVPTDEAGTQSPLTVQDVEAAGKAMHRSFMLDKVCAEIESFHGSRMR